jgi:arabinosyltransferase A/arabinosyltransferase B/arabinosyltransferase C
VLLFGLIAVLAAVAFPFAPVHQPEATYSWAATDGPAALPLMPYQPVEMTARTTCATARGGDRLLLSTVPLQPDPAADPLQGLRLTATGGRVQVQSAGVELGAVDVPDRPCTLSVLSDPSRTTVLVDGTPALTHEGDVRPDVAALVSDVHTGVDVVLVADTRFQTTISPIKTGIAVVGALALLGMLVALARADRAAVPRRVRLLPRRWWLPRPVDAVVTALLVLWWGIGAITVDDGYIAGIVRSTGSNGFIGNVYRWLNAPESPFSWFYGLYYLWSLVSPSTLWMRLPSTLLGLLCWWMLSRLVLPRLGSFAARRGAPWIAALAFATWWIPFNLGLRPESWVAVGALAVFVAIERAIATQRLMPLTIALLLAGATTAITPGGILAFTPFIAAALPVLRLLRGRRDLHTLPVLAAVVAAPAAAVFLMVSDQSLGGMIEATRVRTLIGGGQPWYEEYTRYSLLLEPGSFQGAIGRRAAVLLTVLAAVGVLWALRRVPAGIATGPARRLVAGLLLSLATMTATPTKWTQHFGDVAGYGAAVLVLGLVAFSAAPLRTRPRALVAGIGAAAAVGSLVLAGYNTWPYVGAWFAPTFSTLPPKVAGVSVATITIAAGGLLVAVVLTRWAWQRGGGESETILPRWMPAPAPLVALLLVMVLALQVLALARVAVTHRDSYTLASDALATLRGQPCGLQEALSVETDPAAGLLPVAVPAPAARTVPVDVGGRDLPGVNVAGREATPWFALDPEQRSGALPVVVTTSGALRPGDRLLLEFGHGQEVLERRAIPIEKPEPRDVREMAPAQADTVRLVADAPEPGPRSPAAVSLPRVPRLTPMSQLLPPGSTAILDWPVAFLFPCLTPEPLPLGTAGLAEWRVAPPAEDPSAGITYRPAFGGPFAAPRLLVAEQRMPTYLRGDPTRDAAQLYRWLPIQRFRSVQPVIADHEVPGWHSDGHARVPGLDKVG